MTDITIWPETQKLLDMGLEERMHHAVHGPFGVIFARKFYERGKGRQLGNDLHKLMHVTFLVHGAVQLDWESADGSQRGTDQIVGPHFIGVKANNYHRFTLLTDEIAYFCVFPRVNPDGSPVDPELPPDYTADEMTWYGSLTD
jgi:hypothetical protein